MSRSNRLVFFGNERLATGVNTSPRVLRALVDDGYSVAAIVTNYAPPRSRKARKLEIAQAAEELSIPILMPQRLSEVSEELKSFGAQAGVLVAYGKLVPQNVIDIFPSGILNIHPSLLPAYRGPTPIETAILDGAQQTGVSIMKLVKEMDAGPVYAQSSLSLSGDETKQALADSLAEQGKDLLLNNLTSILDGSAKASHQDESKATYSKLIKKEDGFINLNKPAAALEREIRAYAGWPKSRLTIFGHEVVITKSRLAPQKSDGALILEAHPGLLEVLELIAPSGRTMSAAEFMRGYSKPV